MSNSTSTADMINSPRRLDHSKLVYGSPFTTDDLHYLRARDSRVKFAIDVRVNDAFRNGLIYSDKGKKEIVDACTPFVRKCVKWAMEFGWSIIIHVVGGDDDAAALERVISSDDGESLKIMAWHPFTTELGGVQRVDKDPVTGLPTFFYIRIPGISNEFKINATRCDIYTFGDYSNSWLGLSDLSAALDPTIGLRLWEGTAIRRQRDYATARYTISLPASCFDPITGAPLPAVKVIADDVFKEIPYMLVPTGSGETNAIGGPIDPNESGIIVESVKESIASALAIAVNDMKGASAGEKLGTDANEGTYSMTMKDIQQWATPYVRATFKRMGIEIDGFRSSAELTNEKKYATLAQLYFMFSTAPPGLRKPVAELITNFYDAEFGMDVEISDEDINALDEQALNDSAGGDDGESQTSDAKGDEARDAKPKKKKWFGKK